MENSNERSRQPEINADYIDKLLSISTAPAEEPVTPVAEETAPAPASEAPADTAPVQKAFPTPLLILAGVALLGVGFLLGWLAKPVPEDNENVTLSTSPSGTMVAFQTEPGIAPDYVSMSTQQLVTIAVQIEGLSDFGSVVSATGLQEQAYAALKKDNPVLAELEQRPDAVEQLQLFIMYTSYTEAVQAASALLNYYQTDSMIARDCEWVYHTSDAFTVYEYTQAPTAYTVYTVTPTGVSYTTSPGTMLDFGGLTFLLDGQYPQGGEDPNFWFRIEASDPALVEANGDLSATFIQRTEATFNNGSDLVITQEYPIVSDVSGDGSWVSVCPYGNNEGWFVYGRASTGTFVSTELQTEELSFLPLNLPVLHMPDETLSDSELARFLTEHYVHIIQLQSNNKSRGIAAYPPVSELLSRENGISALLALAQGDYTSSSLVNSFNGGAMFLLTLPCIQQRMNGEQLQAMDRMNAQSYFYAYSFPDSLDELKKEIPENLTDIPAEELNIWIGVFLKSGAQLLRQPDWTLEAQLLSGEGTLFVWEFYDSTVDAVTGWMVSGKVSDVQSVLLRLKQGDTTLELQEVTPVLFTNTQ